MGRGQGGSLPYRREAWHRVNNEKKSALTDRLCGSITKRGANVTDSKYQKRLEVTER
jgi:hypothetical protein